MLFGLEPKYYSAINFHHARIYTKVTIKNQLEKHKFSIEKVSGDYIIIPLIHKLFKPSKPANFCECIIVKARKAV
jgi:hypothetical protein